MLGNVTILPRLRIRRRIFIRFDNRIYLKRTLEHDLAYAEKKRRDFPGTVFVAVRERHTAAEVAFSRVGGAFLSAVSEKLRPPGIRTKIRYSATNGKTRKTPLNFYRFTPCKNLYDQHAAVPFGRKETIFFEFTS